MNKLTRYNLAEIARSYPGYKHSVVCIAYDVAKLEAINAELLEALERCFDLMNNCGTWSLGDQAAARAAIAKAKGEQP